MVPSGPMAGEEYNRPPYGKDPLLGAVGVEGVKVIAIH